MVLRGVRLGFLPLIIVLMCAMLVFIPREGLAAARAGVELWLFNVMPSVLPFVIGANLLIALGAVNFAGVMLSPIMRRVFNVPGTGGFALAVGLVAGYPVGAKIVCEMYSAGELERDEAQRLISFTNNSGPLFVLGAVGIGMFNNQLAGVVVLAAHYLSALAVGLIFRSYGTLSNEAVRGKMVRRAFFAMQRGRKRGPLGQIMRTAVVDGMNTMLMVGGFIVLFSVINRMLYVIGVYDALAAAVWLDDSLAAGLFGGIIEMTNGVAAVAQGGVGRMPLIIASALISFGGVSILLQSLSFIAKTDLRPRLYVLAKALQGVLAGGFAGLLYTFFIG